MTPGVVTLTEGKWSGELALDDNQVTRLRELGRRFMSGAPQTLDDDADDRTLVRMERVAASTWRVRIDNAVGMLAIPAVQIVIEPKIPTEHFIYLLVKSERLPVTTIGSGRVASASTFWELVAAWYVDELDLLIGAGVRRGYESVREELSYVRGRLEVLPSTRNILRGRLALACDYDDFSGDTALNRLLRHAARLVAGAGTLKQGTRHRAQASLLHLHEAGMLRPPDLAATVQSSDRSYSRAIDLAKQVIQLRGRGLEEGAMQSGSFLIRTPEPIEEALRRICRQALVGHVDVRKGRMPLLGSADSMNPDLVFGDTAVGDVKYKVWSGAWHRTDLNQALAFAASFEVREALRVGFTAADLSSSRVVAGPIHVERCDWMCGDNIPPSSAEAGFADRLRAWWVRSAEGNLVQQGVRSEPMTFANSVRSLPYDSAHEGSRT